LAVAALPRVARTGTHLFQFVQYAEALRGWGRVLRRGVAGWYNEQPFNDVAYQVVKYRQRGGWSHRDLLRLAKPVPAEPARDALYRWIVKGVSEDSPLPDAPDLELVRAYEAARTADGSLLPQLITDYGFTWEMLPTEALARADVWRALLGDMPMTAMLRNLGRMTANGLLAPGSDAARVVVERLGNVERLRRARIHPLTVLVALRTYQQGHGEKGKLAWQPVTQIVSALNRAFYDAFGNVEPTGKRIMLALDVSGSMSTSIAGLNVTCREASAAMAMVTMQADPQSMVYGFTSGRTAGSRLTRGMAIVGPTRLSREFTTLDISPDRRLDDIVNYTQGLDFGGTDCALPMLHAAKRGIQIDAFVVYTDNETWAGGIHPFQALRKYREYTGIPAKLVVVGMTSTGFTIADPADGGSLDVVGFDTAAPGVISDFVRG
jgi:60 kDa SS-A/Ro ribonucleoprotein